MIVESFEGKYFPTGQFFKMEEGANRSPSLPTCDEKEKETFHRL